MHHLQAPYCDYFLPNNRTIQRRPVGGRNNRTIKSQILDTVRCPANGARILFCRVTEGKVTSVRHRTDGARPALPLIGQAPKDLFFEI